MPTEVLPITNLSEIGLIEETPAVSLPPNAFTDCQNVRFRDGAARKFPGEAGIGLSPAFAATDTLLYAAFWPAPTQDRYVVVRAAAADSNTAIITVHAVSTGAQLVIGTTPVGGTMSTQPDAVWQHTLFNGGFHFILNNGTTVPVYLQDDLADVVPLPGWGSYLVQETVTSYEYDGTPSGFETINYRFEEGTTIVRLTVTPRDLSQPITSHDFSFNTTTGRAATTVTDGTQAAFGTISNVSPDEFRFTPAGDAAIGGNTFMFRIISGDPGSVTAGVIRSYGNLLVAGNLRESTGRSITGTVRTSDVAAPGNMPQNWNPFRNGANTADELILASTGVIQDMVELQGVMYVYTDGSIHSVQQTGNAVLPFQVGVVTDNYGANGIDSVVEVDGKHIVVGSDDVYIFAGHPGSITSIAEGKVRDQFRTANRWRTARYNRYDEIWFYRDDDTIYIWNYRNQTWTKRNNNVQYVSITPAGRELLLTRADTGLFTADNRTTFLQTSFIERRKLVITPEFDTETLASIAFLTEGSGVLSVRAYGSNAPAEVVELGSDQMRRGVNTTTFDINNNGNMDYKQDIRVHGRFLNYRVTHDNVANATIAGMQFDLAKGGRR